MKQTNPRIAVLQEMMQLEEKRAALQQQLDGLLERIANLQEALVSNAEAAPSPAPAKTPARQQSSAAKSSSKPAQRGALKDRIVAALQAAGEAGVHVKELAQALGTKPVNVHSWFHSSMKRYPAIKKIEGGHYRLQGNIESSGRASKAAPAAAPAASSKGAAKSSAVKGSAAKGGAAKKGKKNTATKGRRGELSAKILNELESAGAQGITVRDLAEKTGVNYKNVSIWFATTGKKNGSIKKVGPAQYRLTK